MVTGVSKEHNTVMFMGEQSGLSELQSKKFGLLRLESRWSKIVARVQHRGLLGCNPSTSVLAVKGPT